MASKLNEEKGATKETRDAVAVRLELHKKLVEKF